MRRTVVIWSEASRLAGDLWMPDSLVGGKKLPAILLCHGWGGLKEHLTTTYAPWFSKAGFAVLTFDYRGWGESEPKLMPIGDIPKPDAGGEITIHARALRQIVDPYDQIRDIGNCLDYLQGVSEVDETRIGLWGSSYGGGTYHSWPHTTRA